MQELTQDKIVFYIDKDPGILETECMEQMRSCMKLFIRIISEADEMSSFQNELIQANSIPGRSDEEIPVSTGYHDPYNLLSVLERTERDMQEYRRAVYTLMETMAGKLEQIRRFQIVYQKIPYEWQTILRRLYHDKEKWVVLEKETGMTHSVFAQHRQAVMQDLCRLYNSSLTNVELARLHYSYRPPHIQESKKNGELQGQIELKLT